MKFFYKDYIHRIFDNSLIFTRLEKYRGSKVLVTGCTGILGFALATILKSLGACVYGHARNLDVHSSKKLASEGVNLINKSLIDYLSTSTEPFDYIVHCATYGQPSKFDEEIFELIRLNTEVLYRCLGKARKVLYASTTEIYSGLIGECTESMSGNILPSNPRALYVESKKIGEALVSKSKNGVSCRIALAAGPFPQLNDQRAIYEIVRRALLNKKVTIRGGANFLRQYQYSFACAFKMLLVLDASEHDVYNIAGPYKMSIEQLARDIALKLNMPFFNENTDVDLHSLSAPPEVNISTDRFDKEFIFYKDIDPSYDEFLDEIIQVCR
jgi:UDP-glucuronate decarboxylase